MQLRALFAIDQIRAQDNGPDEHKQDRRNRGDHGERGNHARIHHQHHHAAQQAHAGEGQAFRRYRTFRQFGEHRRCLTILRQAKQHTAGGEYAAVGRRGRGGQHHEVNQAGRSRQAHQYKEFDERALGRNHRAPRRHRHNHDQREDVEHNDTQRDRVNRARQGFLRIFGFRSGGAHQLNPNEGEDRNLEAGKESADPFREPATVIPQMRKRGFYAGRRFEVHHHHDQADDNQRHDSDDLDHRKPELHFPEHFHGGKVQAQQQQDNRQRGHPVGEAREPELGVGGNRHDVRHPGHHPAEPVGPAGKVSGPRPQKIGGEIAERFIFQIRQQQFAHRTHDEKQHEANDHINKNDGWPGETDGFTGPHK